VKISIIIPVFNPNKKIFGRVKEYLRDNVKGVEIIEIDGVGGLANAYNKGIKKAKGDIVITIHQDCIPLDKDSIKKLTLPFENPGVIMTFSWIKDHETGRKYFPLPPDGKFVAYRKSAIVDVGMFDEKTFFTGGEDVDMWLKLKEKGAIKQVETGIIHIHRGYLGNKTLEKRKQNGSINGALLRIWGVKNPKWAKSLIMCLIHPFSYGKFFIRAFFSGKQKYRREE